MGEIALPGSHDAPQESLTAEEWDKVGEYLGLFPRELQIARYLLLDLSAASIADLLRISPHTVNTYMRRLKVKVAATTRAGIVASLFRAYRALNRTESNLGAKTA